MESNDNSNKRKNNVSYMNKVRIRRNIYTVLVTYCPYEGEMPGLTSLVDQVIKLKFNE